MKFQNLLALGLLSLMATVTADAQQITGTPGSPDATTTIDGRYLPPPPQPFRGQIELNAAQSKPGWPATVVPPKGAPNILLIMTDDVGFSAPSTFGGAAHWMEQVESLLPLWPSGAVNPWRNWQRR
jgi:arylsulfatase